MPDFAPRGPLVSAGARPGGDFGASSSLFGNSLPLADASLVEAWMAINRAWGFEAEIVGCNQDPEARIYWGYGAGQGEAVGRIGQGGHQAGGQGHDGLVAPALAQQTPGVTATSWLSRGSAHRL